MSQDAQVPSRRPSEVPQRGTRPAPAYERSGSDEDLDWEKLLHILWRRKWVIALTTVLGVAAGYGLKEYAVSQEYQTAASVWVEQTDEERGPIEAADVTYGQGWSSIFRSYEVLGAVVRDLHLFLTPRTEQGSEPSPAFEELDVTEAVVPGNYVLRAGSDHYTLRHAKRGVVEEGELGEPIGRSVGFRWDPSPGEISSSSPLRFSVVRPVDAVNQLREGLTVLFDPNTANIIKTRFTWSSPQAAARIHNAVVDSTIQAAYELKRRKLERVVQILEQQADSAADRLQNAELALKNYRVETATMPEENRVRRSSGNLTVQDPLFSDYFSKQLETRELRSDLQSVRAALDTVAQGGELSPLGLRMIPSVRQAPSLTKSLQRLEQLRMERQSLLTRYTSDHPEVEKVTERIRRLEEQTVTTRLRELASQLESRIQNLEGTIQEQTQALREVPKLSIEEARRRREMQMAEKLYQNIRARLKEAELAATTTQPDLWVVDRARPPSEPESARIGVQMFLAASFGGLGFGVVLALGLSYFDDRLRSPDEVDDFVDLPLLGVVPYLDSGDDLDREDALEVLEAFRGIRSQLSRRMPETGGSVLVTSPAPEEGKSLVAANLAVSYANAGREVLLVDGDIRRGNAETFFDVSDEPGLTDYLAGRSDFYDVQRSTSLQGLTFLPHGSLRGFDPNLLESPRMSRLVDGARSRFDAIVVDSPPLASGVDPLILGEHMDRVLLVFRAGQTDREMARHRLAAASDFDIDIAGIVLNAVRSSAPYYRYYSNYYVYPYEQEVGQVPA